MCDYIYAVNGNTLSLHIVRFSLRKHITIKKSTYRSCPTRMEIRLKTLNFFIFSVANEKRLVSCVKCT